MSIIFKMGHRMGFSWESHAFIGVGENVNYRVICLFSKEIVGIRDIEFELFLFKMVIIRLNVKLVILVIGHFQMF